MSNFPTLTKAVLRHFPEWNIRPHTMEDLQIFADQSDVIVKETDLIEDLGEYKVYKEQPFIFIHKYAATNYKPWVFAHETGHLLLHSVDSAKFSESTRKKIEFEANVFASCFFIPRTFIYSKTFNELHYMYGLPKKLIIFRKNLFEYHNKF